MDLFKWIFVIVALSVYFLPSMIAISRRHINALPVFLTNLYLGWTVLGWIGALIWGLSVPAVAAVVATGGAPAAVQAPATAPGTVPYLKRPYLKYTLITLALLFFLFVLTIIFAPTPKKGGDDSGRSNVSAPVRTGVPLPATELLGGE